MDKFYVYVLFSPSTGKFYHGRSETVEMRLDDHNKGKVKSTKHGMPWMIIYTEAFDTLEESVGREKYFKTAAGRKFLKPLKQKYKP